MSENVPYRDGIFFEVDGSDHPKPVPGYVKDSYQPFANVVRARELRF